MNRYYAGIGSRETPEYVLKKMTKIANKLDRGFVLRSGGAKGADVAFEEGSTNKEIFTANDVTSEAVEFSSKFHPNWSACSDYAKKLHGRNAMILFGKDLNTPVEFIVCWTKSGKVTGGTGQALRIAKYYDIKVYNMGLFYE